MSRWAELEAVLSDTLGMAFTVHSSEPVGGGSISDAVMVSDGSVRFFVKRDRVERLDRLEAEARGLETLRGAAAARVPAVVHRGACDGVAVLVLEYIAMRPIDVETSRALGEALVVQHRVESNQFGWDGGNFIGTTPQDNTPGDAWAGFFRERRLRPQLELAVDGGHARALDVRGRRLLEVVDSLLAGHDPVPSLLHGDLWGGNAAADESGAPVLFDPAVYYGDREADLAMTELFGGFDAGFRRAYESAWPLPPGFDVRRRLYNLYHVLNHLNLFGGAYLGQAQRDIDRLLAEVR